MSRLTITMHCGGSVTAEVPSDVQVAIGTRITVVVVPDDVEGRQHPMLPNGKRAKCFECPCRRKAKRQTQTVSREGLPFKPENFARTISCVVASTSTPTADNEQEQA